MSDEGAAHNCKLHVKSGKEFINDLAVKKREFFGEIILRIVADKTGMMIIFYF